MAAKRVYGDPVERDGVTVIPAALVAQVVFELSAHERHTGQLAGPI
jgi:hypothetical protein